jgi:2-dehydropantoate 2-reductase
VFKEVIVYGAGAIGSFLGARVSARTKVTLIGRPDHVRAIKENGLHIGGDCDELVPAAKLQALESIKALPSGALVIVAVKLGALARAADELGRISSGDNTFLLVQNGLCAGDIFSRESNISSGKCRGAVACGVDFEAPGRIAYWGGGIELESTPSTCAIAELLSNSGIEVSVTDDFVSSLWIKLLANCMINPLGALLGLRNKVVMSSKLLELRLEIAEEVCNLAKVEGCDIGSPADLEKAINANLASGGNRCSMLQDISRGSETEIDFLNGYVARRSRELELDSPVNRTLANLIMAHRQIV